MSFTIPVTDGSTEITVRAGSAEPVTYAVTDGVITVATKAEADILAGLFGVAITTQQEVEPPVALDTEPKPGAK